MKWLLAGLFVVVLVFPLMSFGGSYTVNWKDSDSSDYDVNDDICDISSTGLGRCTLRAAIEQANATADYNNFINFSLGTTASNAVIITLATALPPITARIFVDGSSATGYNHNTVVEAAPPRIYIRASSAMTGSTADGFRVFGSGAEGTRIIAIGIRNFPDNGIEIFNTSNVRAYGNWIGVTSDGFGEGNDGAGVYISNCQSCAVGPTLSLDTIGNVISNSGEDGVYIFLGSDNTVSDNLIGGAPVGAYDFGNGGHGIYLGGPENRVGYPVGNTITGNDGDGILVFSGNQMIINSIIRLNNGNGISLNAANNDVGHSSNQGNQIYQNGGHGVEFGTLIDANSNQLKHNEIYKNQGSGAYIGRGNANEVYINKIYDNSGNGVEAHATYSYIHDNLIGLNGSQIVGGAFNGIVLSSDYGLVTRNQIAAMEDDGIDVVSGDGNEIVDNEIGVSEGGVDWGNNTSGVYETGGIRVRSAASNTLIEENYIGFNSNGVILEGSGTKVCGNYVGLASEGEDAGNIGEGIWIEGSANIIGDAATGCTGNYIGFNSSDGIELWGDSNTINDNKIGGISGGGTQTFPNARGGILLYSSGAWSNHISKNQIKFNGSSGVRVHSSAGNGNRIEKNEIDGNGGLGIDLNDDGVTPNDPGDIDTGPNNLQNTPVITDFTVAGDQLALTYRVDSGSLQSVYPLNVDFYYGAGQGRKFILRDSYSVAPNSTKTVVITLEHSYRNNYLTAMTIDTFGNSSEFSDWVIVEPSPLENLIFQDSFE